MLPFESIFVLTAFSVFKAEEPDGGFRSDGRLDTICDSRTRKMCLNRRRRQQPAMERKASDELDIGADTTWRTQEGLIRNGIQFIHQLMTSRFWSLTKTTPWARSASLNLLKTYGKWDWGNILGWTRARGWSVMDGFSRRGRAKYFYGYLNIPPWIQRLLRVR